MTSKVKSPDAPLKLLCFSPYPDEGPSVRHRICGYRELWAEQGIELTLHAFMAPGFFRMRRTFGARATALKLAHFGTSVLRLLTRVATVPWYDAVIIHREAFPLGRPWIEALIARLNPCVTFDVDDAIWHPPSNPVHQRRFFWYEARVPEILRAARLVVVGSPALRDYAVAHNDNVVVIPTTYDDLGTREERPADDRRPPVLVWIGNWGNAHYLAPLLPVLEQLADQFAFRLRLVGGPDIREIHSERFAIEYCPWQREREAEWLRDADVGIMPLEHGLYEEGKCAFKLIQYYSASLPVVASPVGMNVDVVRQEESGFLASTPEGWHEALACLLGDPALRRTLGQGARRCYEQGFTRKQHAHRWADLLRALAGTPRRSRNLVSESRLPWSRAEEGHGP